VPQAPFSLLFSLFPQLAHKTLWQIHRGPGISAIFFRPLFTARLFSSCFPQETPLPLVVFNCFFFLFGSEPRFCSPLSEITHGILFAFWWKSAIFTISFRGPTPPSFPQDQIVRSSLRLFRHIKRLVVILVALLSLVPSGFSYVGPLCLSRHFAQYLAPPPLAVLGVSALIPSISRYRCCRSRSRSSTVSPPIPIKKKTFPPLSHDVCFSLFSTLTSNSPSHTVGFFCFFCVLLASTGLLKQTNPVVSHFFPEPWLRLACLFCFLTFFS